MPQSLLLSCLGTLGTEPFIVSTVKLRCPPFFTSHSTCRYLFKKKSGGKSHHIFLVHFCKQEAWNNANFDFANYTTVINRKEAERASWGQNNNQFLDVSKTQELVVDMGKQGGEHKPVLINGTAVEMVNSFNLRSIHFVSGLTFHTYTCSFLCTFHLHFISVPTISLPTFPTDL